MSVVDQPTPIAQGIHHLHFYLWDLEHWREQFCRVWGFRLEGQVGSTLHLAQGSLRLRLSQPAQAGDEVERYLRQHSPGVVDVALAVGERDLLVLAELLEQRGGQVEWLSAKGGSAPVSAGEGPVLCLRTPYGLRHSLIPGGGLSNSAPAEGELFSHWDHVVLNVEQGSLAAAAGWYKQVLGWQPLYRYSISTEYSGLESVVVGDPAAGIHLAINEPTSATSQIQEFLDVHRGPGIQHAALHSLDIVATLRRLRRAGVAFLQVPPEYYTALQKQLEPGLLPNISWADVVEQQILVDATLPPTDSRQPALLLQTFTQPLFDRPTFFFEIIQRLGGAVGFGEANFQALFEALERQQRQRQQAGRC